MRARIAIAGIMLVLAGTAAAAPAVAQRGRAPGPSRRGGGGRETNPADARTLLRARVTTVDAARSEEHTSELQSHLNLVCRLLLEKKKKEHHSARSQQLA